MKKIFSQSQTESKRPILPRKLAVGYQQYYTEGYGKQVQVMCRLSSSNKIS